jgi:hypothetical protein
LREESLLKQQVVVGLEPRLRRLDGIEILPWKYFLKRFWQDAFAQPE